MMQIFGQLKNRSRKCFHLPRELGPPCLVVALWLRIPTNQPRVAICKDAHPYHGHSVAGEALFFFFFFFVRIPLVRDSDVSRNHSDGYLVSPLPQERDSICTASTTRLARSGIPESGNANDKNVQKFLRRLLAGSIHGPSRPVQEGR